MACLMATGCRSQSNGCRIMAAVISSGRPAALLGRAGVEPRRTPVESPRARNGRSFRSHDQMGLRRVSPRTDAVTLMRQLPAGLPTTTRFTRTKLSDIVHPVSSSQLAEFRDTGHSGVTTDMDKRWPKRSRSMSTRVVVFIRQWRQPVRPGNPYALRQRLFIPDHSSSRISSPGDTPAFRTRYAPPVCRTYPLTPSSHEGPGAGGRVPIKVLHCVGL
jgi:hypothetical protein